MQGVTHGDIQPMNVFYIEDLQCDEKSLKVLDQTLLHEREAGYHRCIIFLEIKILNNFRQH
jgi:hypothetical protein